MAKNGTRTVSFRLTEKEIAVVSRHCEGISIGEYARRLVLQTDGRSLAGVRVAMGRALQAIHYILEEDLAESSKSEALNALELALLELAAESSGKRTR